MREAREAGVGNKRFEGSLLPERNLRHRRQPRRRRAHPGEVAATPPNISPSASATGPPDKRKPAPKPKPASTKQKSSSRG